MRAYERLLNYVVIRTPSDEHQTTCPSSACQFDLANLLVKELQELGVTDAMVDEKCYVYGHIPATPGYESKTAIGFIAHLDTVSDFCDHDIVPQIIENYDGGDVVYPKGGRVLSTEVFHHLPALRGRTLITTDGTTILGADNKAGIAEIMTLTERLMNGEIPHGPVSIAFTPDEEIGSGAGEFDFERFGAPYAYTLDGDTEGEIQYENFNGCKAEFHISGVNVHPGSSKDTMVNASLVAMEVNSMLPAGNTPRDTQLYEGFFHLVEMSGEVGSAMLHYIIRDHDATRFEERQQLLHNITRKLNEKWGEGTVSLTITQQYRNMAEIIATCPHLIEHAKTACKMAGIVPIIEPIRGGTDGAQLSFRGLPCPNLGTGGHGYHGPYEHITAEGMDYATEVAMQIVKLFAEGA
jgi:tripeptide aminopeptidase